jgi:hypothetical protein
MSTARVRRTETSITRHPLRYTCSQTHHAGHVLVETAWPDGESGVCRAYRCSNCEATWVEQHMSARRAPTGIRRPRRRLGQPRRCEPGHTDPVMPVTAIRVGDL